MSRVAQITAIGAAGIIGFDVLASFTSRNLGIPYSYGVLGSWLIYAMVGFSIGRIAPVAYATAGAANVALAEATIGWWLSWIIGPGRPKSVTLTPTQIAVTVVTAVAVGGIIGAIAGAIGRWRAKAATPVP